MEGSITLNGRVLTLAAGSHVVGEIEAGTVVVSGKVDGNVEAKDRLDIKSTAVVNGTLSTARLIVADGSHITAKVEMPREARSPSWPSPDSPTALPCRQCDARPSPTGPRAIGSSARAATMPSDGRTACGELRIR